MSTRAVRRGLLAVLVLVLIGGAWTAYQAWRVNQDLRAAISDASALEQAIEAGDQPAAVVALDDLDGHTESAADRTGGPTFSVLARLPVVGDDVDGVRVAAGVVNDLTDDALTPLVDEATDLESFLPREGRVPVDRLSDLQAPVSSAHVRLRGCLGAALDDEDSSSYVAPLKSKYRELARRVRDTAGALAMADTALQVMPGMLGGTETAQPPAGLPEQRRGAFHRRAARCVGGR